MMALCLVPTSVQQTMRQFLEWSFRSMLSASRAQATTSHTRIVVPGFRRFSAKVTMTTSSGLCAVICDRADRRIREYE